jgi:hypothetical protein
MTLSIPLDSVLRTEELKRRPSRAPGHQIENQALLALAQELATSQEVFCKRSWTSRWCCRVPPLG